MTRRPWQQLCADAYVPEGEVAFLAQVDDAAAERLRTLFLAARDQRERDVARAGDRALRAVPFPLRGLVRKVLG